MEPHRWSAEPIASRMSLCRARGGLKVVPGGSGAALILLGRLLCMAWTISAAVSAAGRLVRGTWS